MLLGQRQGGGGWVSFSSGGEGQGYTTKGSQQSTKTTAMVRAVTTTTTRATKRARAKWARATRAITEPSLRKEGDDGPPPVARVLKIPSFLMADRLH